MGRKNGSRYFCLGLILCLFVVCILGCSGRENPGGGTQDAGRVQESEAAGGQAVDGTSGQSHEIGDAEGQAEDGTSGQTRETGDAEGQAGDGTSVQTQESGDAEGQAGDGNLGQNQGTETADGQPQESGTEGDKDQTEASGKEDGIGAEAGSREQVYDPIDWDSLGEGEDFAQMLDASEASTTGNVKLESKKKGFTGEGYLTGFEGDGDSCSFLVKIPAAGSFDITVVSAGIGGEKVNKLEVDGEMVGTFTTSGEDFGESVLKSIYIEEGEHTISVRKDWGWIDLDSLSIASSERLPGSTFQVKSGLINPNATDRTVKLMQYLQDMYGSYVLSGQFADKGIYSPEIIAIKKVTGDKMPAILGLDFMNYSPVAVAHGAAAESVERALEYDELGGIVTFCWHWMAPEKYHKKGAACGSFQ